MKTVTKILLFGLACASAINAGGWKPVARALGPIILTAPLTKLVTTSLVRGQNNSALTVGKNTLKSLGGSTLAAMLLHVKDKKELKPANKRLRSITKYSLMTAALLAYLAGQNNWNPIKGLRPSALKQLLTTQYSASEQLEFLLNNLAPLALSLYFNNTWNNATNDATGESRHAFSTKPENAHTYEQQRHVPTRTEHTVAGSSGLGYGKPYPRASAHAQDQSYSVQGPESASTYPLLHEPANSAFCAGYNPSLFHFGPGTASDGTHAPSQDYSEQPSSARDFSQFSAIA